MFYSFMIDCLKYYLKYGLVKCEHKNLELRKLYKETSQEFVDFMDEKNFEIEERINIADIYNDFI